MWPSVRISILPSGNDRHGRLPPGVATARRYPYVSPGPLLPGTRQPPRWRGAAGPRTLTRRTEPSPSSELSRLTSTGASSRTWVAQAVESAVTASSPSAKLSGWVCAARSAPTISAHRPNTDPIAARCCQPCESSSPPIALDSDCGSSRRGRPRLAAPGAPAEAAADRPGRSGSSFWSGPGPRPKPAGRSPRARASALATASASTASRARSWPLPFTDHGARADGEPRAVEHRRDVGGHRRGDQDLFGPGHQRGQPVPAPGVELGEHVVEDQHRVLAALAEQREAGQPQRERQRPGLPVAGVAAGRHAADRQLELVPVRADQADAALKLAGPDGGQRLQQGGLDHGRLGTGHVLELIVSIQR